MRRNYSTSGAWGADHPVFEDACSSRLPSRSDAAGLGLRASAALNTLNLPPCFGWGTCDRERARPTGPTSEPRSRHCLDRGHSRQCRPTYAASSDLLLSPMTGAHHRASQALGSPYAMHEHWMPGRRQVLSPGSAVHDEASHCCGRVLPEAVLGRPLRMASVVVAVSAAVAVIGLGAGDRAVLTDLDHQLLAVDGHDVGLVHLHRFGVSEAFRGLIGQDRGHTIPASAEADQHKCPGRD